jgi:hypothetical protein
MLMVPRNRKEDAVSDYLMQEMARIRTEELRAEVARSRAAREIRASRAHGAALGLLAGLMRDARMRLVAVPRGTTGEACCA